MKLNTDINMVPYTVDDVNKVREYYKVTEETIKRDIEILRNWINQQRHLPKNQDDSILERFLLRNKFRIEQTKRKIEGYYTLRGLCREFFQENNEDIIPSREVVVGSPLPKLTPEQERIYWMTLTDSGADLFDLNRTVRLLSSSAEIFIRQDYSIGDKLILDLGGLTFDHFKKVTPAEFLKAVNLYQVAYSGRPIAFDLINVPPLVSSIMSFLKLVFPKKLLSRVHIHPNLESLHRSYPKEYLPRDLGGDLESRQEYLEKLDVLYKQHLDFFSENYFNVSNEALRIEGLEENCAFGVEGTFKQLNLD